MSNEELRDARELAFFLTGGWALTSSHKLAPGVSSGPRDPVVVAGR